jgi:hypothetical protein
MRGFVLPLVVACIVGGCGDSGASEGPQVVDREGVRLLVAGPMDGSRQAGIEGELHLMAGDCLGLRTGASRNALVVWPSGTKLVDGDPATIEVPDLGRITVGQGITASGGDLAEESGQMPQIPEDCMPEGVGLFVIDQAETIRRLD